MVVSLDQKVVVKLTLQEAKQLVKELPGLQSDDDTPITDALFENLEKLLGDIQDGNN